MNAVTWMLVLICVGLNTTAQLLMKVAVDKIGLFALTSANWIPMSIRVALNPLIIFSISIYAVSVVVWLLVLSRMEVSTAYSLSSLGYITTAIAASYFIGEPFNLMRVAGIFVIIAGVYLVAHS